MVFLGNLPKTIPLLGDDGSFLERIDRVRATRLGPLAYRGIDLLYEEASLFLRHRSRPDARRVVTVPAIDIDPMGHESSLR